MIEPPVVVDSPAQPAALIRFDIPREEMRVVMGPGIGELMAAVGAQGVGPAGPVFAHHFRMSADRFQFALGVPVRGAVAPVGRVVAGELPARRVARTVYRGAYEGLGPAWEEFEAWIRAAGHRSAPDLWERYVTGPESGPDPAGWRTELNRPLEG